MNVASLTQSNSDRVGQVDVEISAPSDTVQVFTHFLHIFQCLVGSLNRSVSTDIDIMST